jgi:hypothetical protein
MYRAGKKELLILKQLSSHPHVGCYIKIVSGDENRGFQDLRLKLT